VSPTEPVVPAEPSLADALAESVADALADGSLTDSELFAVTLVSDSELLAVPSGPWESEADALDVGTASPADAVPEDDSLTPADSPIVADSAVVPGLHAAVISPTISDNFFDMPTVCDR
jgi:hypothetical protein